MTVSDQEPKKEEGAAPTKETAPVDDKTNSKENLDEFGYEKQKEDSKEKQKEEPKKEEQKIEAASGYDKEPEKVKDESPPKDEEAKKEASGDSTPKKDEEFEIKDPGDLVAEEIATIKEYVKTFKISKDAANGLVELEKAKIKKLQTAMKDHREKQKQEVLKVKRTWYEELRADTTFAGDKGDKFDFNRNRVEKVLQDFLPSLKKRLTKTDGMLPPDDMKDLAKLGEHLYSNEEMVNGEPSKTESKSKEKEKSPLDFYNS